jgi:hypothetical protein
MLTYSTRFFEKIDESYLKVRHKGGSYLLLNDNNRKVMDMQV